MQFKELIAMKKGHRLYSKIDRRYYGGVFETQGEVANYAVYIGLALDEYEIHGATTNHYDSLR